MANNSYHAFLDLTVHGHLTVIGDLHGKINVFEAILRERQVETGLQAGDHTLVSLGDLIDRGPTEGSGEDIVFTGAEALVDRFVELKAKYPDQVHVVAGNHEARHVDEIGLWNLGVGDVSAWGSLGRLRLTADRLAFLKGLPVALVLSMAGVRAVVVHAGAPERAFDLKEKLSGVESLADAHRLVPVRQLLWSNPSWSMKAGGFYFAYGESHLGAFLETNRAQVLIRGHTDESEIMELPGGRTYICVHSAQGDEGRDADGEGYVYLAWDPPAGPTLITQKGSRGPAT
ncbi:MAG: serine/threonine protein phosphatase [Candidatus Riflebacteria bacterium]|nr:serine/threonine protein phosphatase [Candidatus Riflebacteria bacterium]